MLLTAF